MLSSFLLIATNGLERGVSLDLVSSDVGGGGFTFVPVSPDFRARCAGEVVLGTFRSDVASSRVLK